MCVRLLLLSFISASFAQNNCSIDQIYDPDIGKCCERCLPTEDFQRCGTCPLTCEHPEPRPCTADCKPGCYCKKGLIRDEDSRKCVKRDHCCRENEVYSPCGGYCEPTCDQPRNNCPTLYRSLIRIDVCSRNCTCKLGTVRDENTGQCVPLEKCSCPKGQHYELCQGNCQRTCSDPDGTQCTATCITGCVCNNCYVFDEATRTCVPLENCTCKPNEVFQVCGPACPPTCDNPKGAQNCTDECVRDCFCKGGLIRDNDIDDCVKPESCTKRFE